MDGPGGLTFSGVPTRQDACWAWASRRSSWRQACAFLRCTLFPFSLSAPASIFSFPHSACHPSYAHASSLSHFTLLALPVYSRRPFSHLNRVPRIPAPHFPLLSLPRSLRMSSASLTPHSANLSPHFSTRWAVSNFTKKRTPTAWVREGGEREMRE